MVKRVASMLLCLILVGNMLFSYKLTVQASAVIPISGVDAETSAELIYLLYSLMTSGSIASGIDEGLGSYSESEDLVKAFNSFVASMATPDVGGMMDDLTVTLDDGSVMTLSQINELVSFAYGTDGSSALAPDVSDEEAAAFRQEVMSRLQVIDGGGGSAPEDPEDPDQDPQNPFSKIKSAVIGTGFLTGLGEFFGKLYHGQLEDLEADHYWNIGQFTGEYDIVGGQCQLSCIIYRSPEFEKKYGKGNEIYVDTSVNVSDFSGTLPFLVLSPNESTNIFSILSRYYDSNGTLKKWNSLKTRGYVGVDSLGVPLGSCGGFSANFPVFSSFSDAYSYFFEGNKNAPLNAPVYDFPNLANSVPETLAPLTGIRLNPNSLPDLNNTLATAAQAAAVAEPAETIEANNNAYRVAVQEAAIEAAPAAEAAPEPVPDPFPDPEVQPADDIDPETGSMTAELTGIFPFCLPFDLIRLLRALDADPECPVFEIPISIPALDYQENVEIDLSFLEPGMEVVRIGELGFFILMLIAATSKMIKW